MRMAQLEPLQMWVTQLETLRTWVAPLELLRTWVALLEPLLMWMALLEPLRTWVTQLEPLLRKAGEGGDVRSQEQTGRQRCGSGPEPNTGNLRQLGTAEHLLHLLQQ
ncbi:hypothetical protein AMECASPLE_017386 [Ameca splendens]|uniref:Uncharacterized protein n=1 Tax=Ameca splendens TaxID=208324 RepID=A0ABV1A8W1_9TELE